MESNFNIRLFMCQLMRYLTISNLVYLVYLYSNKQDIIFYVYPVLCYILVFFNTHIIFCQYTDDNPPHQSGASEFTIIIIGIYTVITLTIYRMGKILSPETICLILSYFFYLFVSYMYMFFRLKNNKVKSNHTIIVNKVIESYVDDSECAVCLETMLSKNVSILDCKHSFHSDCIKKLTHYNCPLCRQTIVIHIR